MKPDLPNVDFSQLQPVDPDYLKGRREAGHPPRILLLYGSLRNRSFSRLVALEAERLLKWHGCETRIFDPHGLPLPDSEAPDHPKVRELRDLATWSEGMVWVSPERHGAMTGIMKAQIDWLPLELGATALEIAPKANQIRYRVLSGKLLRKRQNKLGSPFILAMTRALWPPTSPERLCCSFQLS